MPVFADIVVGPPARMAITAPFNVGPLPRNATMARAIRRGGYLDLQGSIKARHFVFEFAYQGAQITRGNAITSTSLLFRNQDIIIWKRLDLKFVAGSNEIMYPPPLVHRPGLSPPGRKRSFGR